MPLTFIFEALGGLGLFILGMRTMSEGMHKIAGERLRTFLEKTTGNRLTAALLGSCLASILQSGSAASILVVCFVNAGLLSLYQAIGVLLGTAIGTTIAIQFIAFKITSFALPAIFIGVIIRFFCNSRKLVNIGILILGTGLVFFGLQIMETGFSPFKQSALYPWFHQNLFSGMFSSILAGALLTFFIQSGSAAIAIIIALAGGGLLHFDSAVAMVIGEIIGSSLLTVIAALGGTLAAKRAVLVYFVINIAAITIVMLLFEFFLDFVQFVSPGIAELSNGVTSKVIAIQPVSGQIRPNIARQLANAHTLFSILSVIIFLPLIGFLVRSASTIFNGREDDTEPRSQFIDYRVINTPTIALLQAKNEMKRMAAVAESMYKDLVDQFHSFNTKTAIKIREKEEVLDILQRDISSFLITISQQQLSSEYVIEIPTMLQLVNDLEHIGDQCEIITDFLRRKKEEKLRFSNTAMSELKLFVAQIAELVARAVHSLDNPDEIYPISARALLDKIQCTQETLHKNHISRLHNGKCSIVAGLLFGDMIAAFGRIAQISYEIIETEREFVNVTTSSSN